MSTPLVYTHLRFDLEAEDRIRLDGYQAGDRLRNALAQVMLRSACPQTIGARPARPTAEHAAECPVCWLLAAEVEPGDVRRAYSIVPPIPPRQSLAPGELFDFALTLFGDGLRFLPYFALAIPEMGCTGVGPGRGSFKLRAIYALNPFNGRQDTVLAPGERLVHPPDLLITWDSAVGAAKCFQEEMKGDPDLWVEYLTPTRLIDNERTVHSPDFGIFFRRLLQRIDDLARQLSAANRRDPDELNALIAAADRVRLVDASVAWIDVMSWSGRTRSTTPMGGFVGKARYRSSEWDLLLPWLLFGQGVQVGKLTVKGNGVYRLRPVC